MGAHTCKFELIIKGRNPKDPGSGEPKFSEKFGSGSSVLYDVMEGSNFRKLSPACYYPPVKWTALGWVFGIQGTEMMKIEVL